MLKIKLLHEDAKVPTRAYEGDAGVDLYAIEDVMVSVHKGNVEMLEFANLPPDPMIEVRTGIAIALPKNLYSKVECRSSLGRRGIRVHPGIIDSGYRNEITVFMQNLGTVDYIIKKGDKIAQLVIMPISQVKITVVEELEDSERGKKGHGSSGK